MVSAYRYLGTVIDNKQTHTLMRATRKHERKCTSNGSGPGDYATVLPGRDQNAIFFNMVCFFGNAKKGDIGRLEKITRTAGRIMTADPLSPSDIFQRDALRKLAGLQVDTSHPVNAVVQSCAPARDSSRRLHSLKSRTTRQPNSFIPVAIRLHNASL